MLSVTLCNKTDIQSVYIAIGSVRSQILYLFYALVDFMHEAMDHQ